MKNITVSVDEETYRLSRVKAAEVGTSVSALVRKFLMELAESQAPEVVWKRPSKEDLEAVRQALQKVRDSLDARGAVFSASDSLPRDELYNRDALR